MFNLHKSIKAMMIGLALMASVANAYVGAERSIEDSASYTAVHTYKQLITKAANQTLHGDDLAFFLNFVDKYGTSASAKQAHDESVQQVSIDFDRAAPLIAKVNQFDMRSLGLRLTDRPYNGRSPANFDLDYGLIGIVRLHAYNAHANEIPVT